MGSTTDEITAALRKQFRGSIAAARLAPSPYYRAVALIGEGEERQELELTRFFLTTSGSDVDLAGRLAGLAKAKLAALGFDAASIAGTTVKLEADGSPPSPSPSECRTSADYNRWRASTVSDVELKEVYSRLAASWDKLASWREQ